MRDARVGRLGRQRGFRLAAALMLLSGSSLAWAGQTVPQSAERDFLFGRPRGWIGLRGSWLIPAEGGELFSFVNEQLTIDKGDFQSAAFSGEAGFALSSRLEAVFGVEAGKKSVTSEYRHFIDNQGLPINQTTALTQTNITGGIRFALLDRGRSVSRYAFVARTITPFVGAGGGVSYHRFSQAGDFVDFVTLKVFRDTFRSIGFSPSAHVFGGADVRMWRSIYVTADGRYVWTHGNLGPDFVGFDGIDLNGFRLSSGVSFFIR